MKLLKLSIHPSMLPSHVNPPPGALKAVFASQQQFYHQRTARVSWSLWWQWLVDCKACGQQCHPIASPGSQSESECSALSQKGMEALVASETLAMPLLSRKWKSLPDPLLKLLTHCGEWVAAIHWMGLGKSIWSRCDRCWGCSESTAKTLLTTFGNWMYRILG